MEKTSVGSAAQAELSNVDIDIATEFEIALANKAAAELKFSDLKYDLQLNGEKFLSGVPVDIINNGKESIVKLNEFSAEIFIQWNRRCYSKKF